MCLGATCGPSFFCFYSCPSPATGQRGGTVRAYPGGFNRWRRRASSNHLCHLPIKSLQFAPLYLQCRLNEANCPSPLVNDLFSLDWAQNLAGLPKISDHPLVSSMICAAQIVLGSPRQKKESCHPGDAKSSYGIQNKR